MRERAELLGGRLAAAPTSDGFRVELFLPGMTGDDPIRVLLADDQRVVREGLAMLLELLPGVEVVGTAADGEEAVALAIARAPDVILMDLRMPRVDGVEATRRIAEVRPQARVIALTTYADEPTVLSALRAGARGYLTKDAGAEEIAAAIDAVARGDAALDPAVQAHVLAGLAEHADDPVAARRADAARGRGADADRRGADQLADRGPARGEPGDRQEPRQPRVRQGRRPRPRAGGRLRVPQRARRRLDGGAMLSNMESMPERPTAAAAPPR